MAGNPSSDDKFYTRFDESLLDDGDFVDAGMMNRCIGNLDHLADQMSQNRVKWILDEGAGPLVVDSDVTPGAGTYFGTIDGRPVLNLLWRSPAFDLHLRETGETYKCRARLRFGSADAVHTTALRVALAPPGFSDVAINDVTGPNTLQTTTQARTAHAWEDIASLIYLDTEWVRRASSAVSTVDSVGGEVAGATWIRAELVVAATVSNPGATAELSGVELTEYFI